MKRYTLAIFGILAFMFVFVVADRAEACLELPLHPPDVTISGDACQDPFLTVTLHDYSTFAASNEYCACALNIPLTFGHVLNAQVVESATGLPVSSFPFVQNGNVSFGFGSASWQGFSSFVGNVVGQLAVDLVFQVDPSPEIPCADAADQLADSIADPPGGVLVGTGGAAPDGEPESHIGVSEAGEIVIVGELTPAGGRICGTKFQDLNLNGIRDPGEPGLAGWQIVLTNKDGKTRVITTDAEGNYCFTGLASGTYTVQEMSQKGWLQTAPSTSSHSVALRHNERRFEVDFGNGCCESGPRPDLELSLNTGYDQAAAGLIPLGQIDDDWMIVQDANGGSVPRPAEVVSDLAWSPPLNGRWITSEANGANAARAARGTYVYRYCFCLDSKASDASLDIQLRADNSVTGVELNGFPLAGASGGPFNGTPLALSADPHMFLAGEENCLEVEIFNQGLITGLALTGTVRAENGLCCGPNKEGSVSLEMGTPKGR